MGIMLPSYMFLRFCGLFITLLLSTWFYYSVAFLLPSSYSLFSLLCGLFMAKMLGRHWLQIIMLWSGGAVNLRSDFGRHYAIFLTWSLGRNILASCDWILAVLRSFERGRWELSNDAKTARIRCLDAELLRPKVLEKKYGIVLAEIKRIHTAPQSRDAVPGQNTSHSCFPLNCHFLIAGWGTKCRVGDLDAQSYLP